MIGALIGAILPSAISVIDKLIPDKALAAKLAHELKLQLLENEAELEKSIFEAAKAQLEVNAEEAKHPSVFVAGWRPFIGWTGGFGLVYQFILNPLMVWGCSLAQVPAPPTLDSNSLIALVTGMLGLGAFRTYEKGKDVATTLIRRAVK
jgi:hypothetical protein